VQQRHYKAGELLTLPTAAGHVPLHYACGAGKDGLGVIAPGFSEPDTRVAIASLLLTHVHTDVNVRGESSAPKVFPFAWPGIGRENTTIFPAGLADGMTALHFAARNVGSVSLLELLLSHGAQVNVLDARGMSPLHYALQHGHLAFAERLLADPKARTVFSEGPVAPRNAVALACAQPSASPALLAGLLERTRADDPSLSTLNAASDGAAEVSPDC
jgi:hypothetical protein